MGVAPCGLLQWGSICAEAVRTPGAIDQAVLLR